jgi:hypothetical protein
MIPFSIFVGREIVQKHFELELDSTKNVLNSGMLDRNYFSLISGWNGSASSATLNL